MPNGDYRLNKIQTPPREPRLLVFSINMVMRHPSRVKVVHCPALESAFTPWLASPVAGSSEHAWA